MYTIESLKPLNARFLSTHLHLTDWDVQMVNKWVNRVEATRDKAKPVAMDTLRYYNKYGDYYAHALISRIEDGQAAVCEVPYTPFLYESGGSVGGSASGGAWAGLPVADMVYVGQEKRLFTDWGHCGACADGAVDFEATVNVWEYHTPDKLFGEYNTSNWEKMHVQFREKPSDFGYQWFGDGHAWKNKGDYMAWLMTYKGVEFDGAWENQTVVFFYRRAAHLISRAEWDALELPIDTRMMNGAIQTIKYKYDDENHVLHEYRHSNSGDIEWCADKPYRVAHEMMRDRPARRIILKSGWTKEKL